MKSKYLKLSLILLTFSLTMCNKQDGVTPSLAVTPPGKEIDNGSATFYLDVKSTVAWSARCDQGWITLSPVSGNRNGTIKVQCQPNPETNTRTALITISGKDVEDKVVTVSQTGTLPFLTLFPTSQVVTRMAGNTTFMVSSNVSWTATSSQNWCTLVNPSGQYNDTLSVNYEANTTPDERIAIITITGNGIAPKTVTLKQHTAITYLVNDNFESYAANSFPFSGGWVLKYNGAGDSYQVVTDAQAHSGSKSFQILGTYSWSSVVYQRLSTTPPVLYFETWVRTSGKDALIDFSNRDEGTWGTGYANIYLGTDSIAGTIGNASKYFQSYSYNQWYKVKLKYNSTNSRISVWVNDILKISDLPGNVSSVGYQDLSMLSGWAGSYVYFDDVKVWYEE